MTKLKILVVEDESIVALGICDDIQELGYEVSDVATNYEEAIKSFFNNEPDILLMDINLGKGKNGIEIVKEIHKTKQTPVIYLTAYSDNQTIEKAVNTNPISYLIKPLNIEELKAAIKLSIYKTSFTDETNSVQEYLNLGYHYYFDLENKNLYYKNRPIKLGDKEKKLLLLLIKADGAIVSFENITNNIWENEEPAQSSLRTLLYRLRSKLEYRLIETISTMGCRLKKVDDKF